MAKKIGTMNIKKVEEKIKEDKNKKYGASKWSKE